MPDKEKLLQIVNDLSSSPAERAEAQRELDADGSVTAADTRLENELLFQYHAVTLGDIQHHDLHAFCSNLKFSAASQNLYLRWLEVSPAAQSKMRAMKKHLRNYLIATYESLVKRYGAALETGGDLTTFNQEALEFYKSWADSTILPETMRKPFREMIAVLCARCEGHHDHQN